MNLLITGICGFVGSVLARTLREHHPDWKITGLDNLSRPGSWLNREPLQQLGIEIRHGDIRNAADLESMEKVDWVIDAAANPSVLAGVDGKTSSRQLVEHNLQGTINMLEFCRRHGSGFILLSTSRVYSIPPLADLKMIIQSPEDSPPAAPPGVSRLGGRSLDLHPLSSEALAKGDPPSDLRPPTSAHRPPTSALRPPPSGPSRFSPDPDQTFPEGITPAGVNEAFSTTPPVSLYGSTKVTSEHLALEYGATFDFPVWINRCGVMAGAGQFGHPAQGIFAFWIHSFREQRPLKYIGFDGQGHQVRDCLHPRDLLPLLHQQIAGRKTEGGTRSPDASRRRETKSDPRPLSSEALAKGDPTSDPRPPTSDLRPPTSDLRITNIAGGLQNSMSLAELTAWCQERFNLSSRRSGAEADPGLQPSHQPETRPFDIPWMVLDPTQAKQTWDWTPQTPILDVLEEIAQFAEAHPDWLRVSMS